MTCTRSSMCQARLRAVGVKVVQVETDRGKRGKEEKGRKRRKKRRDPNKRKTQQGQHAKKQTKQKTAQPTGAHARGRHQA